MGKLLEALKKGDMEELNRLTKEEVEKHKKKNVPESLRRTWDAEDRERKQNE